MQPVRAAHVVLLALALVGGGAAQLSLIPSQTPTIDPQKGVFKGEVIVKIVPNGPIERTRIYYTAGQTPGTDPELTDDPKVLPKGTQLLVPNRHVLLNEPGNWVVKAMAVTEGQGKSNIAAANLTVEPGDLDHPQMEVTRLNGRINVTLTGPEGAEIFYAMNGLLPSRNTTKYNGTITFGVGDYILRAVAYKGDKRSPTAEKEFHVDVPIAYRVVATCKDCNNTATVGKPFTLIFSGFIPNPQSKVFLSTHPAACSRANDAEPDTDLYNELQGCNCPRGFVPSRLHRTIISNEEPRKVYVCLTLNGKMWKLLENDQTKEQYFTLSADPTKQQQHTEVDFEEFIKVEPAPYTNSSGSKDSTGLMMWLALAVVVAIFVVVVLRRR